MGVDKAGQNHAPAQIEFFRFASFGKARHAVSRSSRNDVSVTHQYGAIAHKTGISHRRTASGNVAAKCEEFFAARNQKGLGHDMAIMAQ
jgi:hypothetical protein